MTPFARIVMRERAVFEMARAARTDQLTLATAAAWLNVPISRLYRRDEDGALLPLSQAQAEQLIYGGRVH